MKKRVYIETSIPSFYHEIREEPEMVAQRNWTREWWDNQKHHYECVTSLAVIEELESGDYPTKKQTLETISEIPVLAIDSSISEIIEVYVEKKLMPADIAGDAFHLAVASVYSCNFLLTWNCTHLANANKFDHIKRINTMIGLYVPTIITPFELLKWEEDSDED